MVPTSGPSEPPSGGGDPPQRYAVVLYFDAASSERVEALERAAGAAPRRGDERPHLTLATLGADGEEAADAATLRRVAAAFATRRGALELRFAATGAFPGAVRVVFLAPVVTPRLLELHADLHRALRLAEQSAETHTLPGAWVPHATVAQQLSSGEVGAVIERARERLPLAVRAVEVGAVRLFPVRSLGSHALRGVG